MNGGHKRNLGRPDPNGAPMHAANASCQGPMVTCTACLSVVLDATTWQHNAFKRGSFTREAMAERAQIRELVRQTRKPILQIK